ncbi:MAG: LysM peptidoglycan-binding domain-containing protein [Ruminiclostridium sp.]|nr:LysM peptidoglycan-binding domain-containing protein [Ruminiclostridium sp.]
MTRFKKTSVLLCSILLTVLIMAGNVFAAAYKVVANDSLYKIGTLFNTSVSTIRSDNGLTSDLILPGQELSVRALTYTVKSGDSLYTISQKNGVPLYSLRKANNKWDNTLYPGQKLLLPGKTATESGNAVIAFTQSDVDLLARLITAEADNQPYDAKVGVGAVVVNRVRSQDFPNSIKSVIYQVIGGYYQFTPVENGYINNPASADAKKAAYAALYGSDPSKGSLFYFDDSATNKWLWSKPIRAYIGKMVFVY